MESRQVLSSIAKLSKSRVRPSRGFFPRDGGDVIATAHLRCGGLSGEVYATQNRMVFEVRSLEQSLVFSINQADEWHEVSEVLELASFRLLLYGGTGSEAAKKWAEFCDHSELLAALELTSDEYLHVYLNGAWLSVGLHHDFESLLHSLGAVVRALPSSPTEDVQNGVEDLPEVLRPLSQYFKAWAISDDAERTAKTQKASKKQRQAVCAVVEPLLPEIDRYLASLSPGRESPAALRLGYLAEAVVEMRQSEA